MAALGRHRRSTSLHRLASRLGNLLSLLSWSLLFHAWHIDWGRIILGLNITFRFRWGPGMDTFHVIKQIPAARKSIVWGSTVTSIIMAKMWHFPMAVEPMSLSLMTEPTGSRGEPGIGTLRSVLRLATVGLQMRVEIFATGERLVWKGGSRVQTHS